MPLFTLPSSLWRVRAEYKQKQKRFQRWLSNAAEAKGLNPFAPSAPSHPEPLPSTARGKGKKKGKQSARPAPKPAPSPTIPLELSVGQLRRLAAALAQTCVREKTPQPVLDLLSSVIDARRTVASHYAQSAGSTPEMAGKNAGHRFMIKVLEEIRQLLSSCGSGEPESEEVVGQLVRRMNALSFLSSDGLEEDDGDRPAPAPDPNEWLPASYRRALPQPAGPKMAERPLADFNLIEDADGSALADEDVAMAAFCFLSDAERLTEYCGNAWEAYAKHEITLSTAAVLSSQAVQLAKDMEEELRSECGAKLAGDYESIVRSMMGLRDLSHDEFMTALELQSPDLRSFLRVLPFVALSKFTTILSGHPLDCTSLTSITI